MFYRNSVYRRLLGSSHVTQSRESRSAAFRELGRRLRGEPRGPHCAPSGTRPWGGPEASGLQLPGCRGPGCIPPAQTWWQLRPLPGGGAAGSVLSGRRQRAGWVWAGFGDICGLGWGRLSPWLVRVGRRDPNPRLLQSKALTSTWRDAEPSSEAPQPSEPHIPLPVVPRILCPPPKPPSLPRSSSYLPLTATWASPGEAQDGVLRGPGTQGHLWRV